MAGSWPVRSAVSIWSTWIASFDFDGDPGDPNCPDPGADPENYGTGTAGTGGLVPQITVNSCPATGNQNFQILASDFLPNTTGVCFIGLADANIDGGGWTLLVDAALSLAVTYPGGTTNVPIGIPNNPFLDGLEFFAQFIGADAGAPGGVSATDGLKMTICND